MGSRDGRNNQRRPRASTAGRGSRTWRIVDANVTGVREGALVESTNVSRLHWNWLEMTAMCMYPPIVCSAETHNSKRVQRVRVAAGAAKKGRDELGPSGWGLDVCG